MLNPSLTKITSLISMFTAVGEIDFRAKRPEFNSTHLARLVREGEYSTHSCFTIRSMFTVTNTGFEQILWDK